MPKQIFICLLLFFNLLIVNNLLAQHYGFRSYELEEGLPQSEVWDIMADKRGYLWVGTNGGGLARFNGKNFQVFTKKHGLIDEQPRTLFQDSKGNIWIGTFRGLSVYNGNSFTNYGEKDGIKNAVFSQFIEDAQGHIWVYLFQNNVSRQLFRFENGKIIDLVQQYNQVFNAQNPPIGIFKDRNGIIYTLLPQNGLMQFKDNQWTKPTWATHEMLKDKPAIGLFCHDSQDRLWFTAAPPQGNANEIELFYLKDNTLQKVTLPTLPASGIIQVFEDSQKNVWFPSFTQGAVCLHKDGSTIHYTQDNGLTSNFLNKIAEDKEGNIWFASRGKGIIRFDKGKFIAFNEDDGLRVPFVRAIYEDEKGMYWFGTAGGGLTSYDGKKLKTYFGNDINLGRIKWVGKSEEGKLLITSDVGMAEIEGESYQKVNKRYGLPENALTSYVCKATVKGEVLWFITTFNQGFYIYNPQKPDKTTNYQTGNSIVQANYVHSALQDAQERVWICTNAGLVCYEDGKLTNYGKADGLLNELVIQVCPDKHGGLWIATYGEGLAYFDGKKFTHTTPQNSNLASSVIYSVMLDNEGNMWAGTQKGVDKITFDKAGKIARIKNYDRYDGFSGLECNGAANFKDSKGNLWFGTVKGVLRYNPAEDKPNITAPKLNITNLRLFFREVAWAGKGEYSQYHAGISEWFGLPQKLVLPNHQNHLTFDFEAISFQSSEKVRYQWKLEGIDKDWTPETDKTEAVYPNLPAGTYTFKVKAMNNDGIWSETASYQFSILPAWYQTWWATLLAVLLVAGIITLAVRWRINALKAYQKHLEKQVAEKTAEITEQNAILHQQKEEITIQAENLQEANHEITKRQQEITDSINYAKRIQDAILPQPQSIQALLPESFILFRPRDIVSGDFYWFVEVEPFRNKGFKIQTSDDSQDIELISSFTKSKGKVVIAAADCTGHGVPGAFMSMIGNELLHEIVTEKQIHSPEQILYFLHARVRQALKQDETTNRDGMDISICLIDRDKNTLEYAGARSRMLYIQDGEMHELKGDKFPIGGEQREIERTFTKQTVPLLAGKAVLSGKASESNEQDSLPTTLYMFSDGYIDQFGGKERKKFRISQLREILLQNHHKPMPYQQEALEKALDEWIAEGRETQIDDVMVLGIRL